MIYSVQKMSGRQFFPTKQSAMTEAERYSANPDVFWAIHVWEHDIVEGSVKFITCALLNGNGMTHQAPIESWLAGKRIGVFRPGRPAHVIRKNIPPDASRTPRVIVR